MAMSKRMLVRTCAGTLAAGILLVGLRVAVPLAEGGTFTGTFTGYAMGNLQGASGTDLIQTDFANHSPTWCPGDPAASWDFGSRIQYDSGIAFYDSNDDWYGNDKSWLQDIGDLSCSQGDYWVDLYFGRYKFHADDCDCPGSPSGVCWVASSNSCTHAIDFGDPMYGYDKIQ